MRPLFIKQGDSVKDENRTKSELIQELKSFSKKIKKLEAAEHKRKQTEEALHVSEDNYRLLFDNCLEAVFLSTPDGNILDANNAACRLFGCNLEELRQIGRSDIVDTSDPRFACALEERIRTGKFKGELTFIRKDGTKFSGELSIAIFKDRDENPRLSLFIRDITERKWIEEEQAYQTQLHKFRSDMTYSINRQDSLGGILQRSAEVIIRNFDIACAQIWHVNREVNSLELLAHAGITTPCTESDECNHIGNLLAGKVMAEGCTIASNSILEEPLLTDISWTHQNNIIAYAGLPLFIESGLLGVLVIFSRTMLQERTLSPLAGAAVTLAQGIERKLVEMTNKRIEETLRESEEKYRNLVERADDGITIVQDDIVKFANWRIAKMWGGNVEDIIGTHFTDFAYPDERPKILERYKRRMAGDDVPSIYEVMLQNKNGNKVPVELNAGLITYQGKLANLVIIRDITERKRAEGVIHFQSKIMENLSEGVYLVRTSDSTIVYANSIFEKMFGYNQGELIGKNVSVVNAPTEKKPEETASEIMESLKKNKEWHGEVLNIRKNGSHFWCHASVSTCVHPEYGTIWISVHTDITERKRTEAALHELAVHLQTIREEERTRIAREIHDELGQALTGLKMELAFLEHTTSDALPLSQSFIVTTKLESMMALVDTTIGTVRRISTELRPVLLDGLGLAAAIEWEAEEFQKKSGIKCEYDLRVKEYMDTVKETAVFRILQESLTNIFRHAKATHIQITYYTEGDDNVLIIHDNGIGITNEQQSDYKSLGLLGMKERAFALGGNVEIDVAEGSGTTVTVKIPLSKT